LIYCTYIYLGSNLWYNTMPKSMINMKSSSLFLSFSTPFSFFFPFVHTFFSQSAYLQSLQDDYSKPQNCCNSTQQPIQQSMASLFRPGVFHSAAHDGRSISNWAAFSLSLSIYLQSRVPSVNARRLRLYTCKKVLVGRGEMEVSSRRLSSSGTHQMLVYKVINRM